MEAYLHYFRDLEYNKDSNIYGQISNLEEEGFVDDKVESGDSC